MGGLGGQAPGRGCGRKPSKGQREQGQAGRQSSGLLRETSDSANVSQALGCKLSLAQSAEDAATNRTELTIDPRAGPSFLITSLALAEQVASGLKLGRGAMLAP